MNLLATFRNAYSTLDRRVSAAVDRIEGENVARLKRQEICREEIERHRRQLKEREAGR